MNVPDGLVLGLDLGGTNVKAGVVSARGEVVSVTTRPSGERGGVSAWVAAGLGAAEEALASSGVAPIAAGLAVPGAVDPATSRLIDLVERLPSSGGIDLVEAFGSLGLPLAADNDARAALAAERRWGGYGGCEDLVVLTLGTGIGGAAVVGGRAPGGDRVLAGNQLGHLTVELNGAECVCGNRGCAETVASGTALVASARAAGLDVADAAGVFAAERRGDEGAGAVVERFVVGLAATVVNAIHAYQPEVVVLAGGIMASAERFLDTVRAEAAARSWTLPRGRVRVEQSALGACAGVLAGAAVAFEQMSSLSGAGSPSARPGWGR